MYRFICRFGLYFAWLVSILAVLVSLYVSEVLKIAPCTLCWYQRICLFSLVPTLGIASYRRDTYMYRYVLPQVTIGTMVAGYQILGSYFSATWVQTLCRGGMCFEPNHGTGSFFSMLSLSAFVMIGVFVLLARKGKTLKGENL